MAKGSRGGKLAGNSGLAGTMASAPTTTTSASTSQAQAPQPQAQPQQTAPQPAPQFKPSTSKAYNDFVAMSDDEKADVIRDMSKKGVPVHLADNDFQSVLYNLGINDRPTVVDDADFDDLKGTTLYRTINSVYDDDHDISYTPTQIANQLQRGRQTRVSDSGGSYYGRGIYFADDYDSSAMYGNKYNDITKTGIVRMKLNSTANVISYSQANRGFLNEISKGTKLGKALANCDSDSQTSLWALAKGYNVIQDRGSGYTVVLDRRAMTINSGVKALNINGDWI